MAIFTNQATVTYNNTVLNSNIATGELLETLTATKTAVVDEYSTSDRIAYVVSIINTGTTPFTGLTLTDTLGAYTYGNQTVYPLTFANDSVLYYVNGVLQGTAPTAAGGPPLTLTGINVPAGGNATIIYEVDVNEFAPLAAGSTILNTATISGAGIVTPVTATATVTAEAEPRLAIIKSISPAVVTENSQVTYSITLQNYGNTTTVVTDNVTVTDTLNPILTNVSVSLDGAQLNAPADYTYNEATGEFATVPGRIVVPAATYTQDAVTGAVTVIPGTTVLTITGTI